MILAHLDLDAFFAAVEELEDPSLRAKPLVVGGDPRGRGVVATANYAARRFGIHSAMSCAEALRRCPHAVFMRPRKSLYREYSGAVWAAVREVVPTIERTGMDEGYLDLGELAEDFLAARALAEAVQASVRERTSLSASLGVASCKVVAKVASDRRKPGGLTVVPRGREAAFLAPFPIRRLPGIGPRAEERLHGAGIETIGGAGRTSGRRGAPAPAGEGRGAAPRPCARHRSATAGDVARDRVHQPRGDLRPGCRRPVAPEGRAAPDVPRASPNTWLPLGSSPAPSPPSSATRTSRSAAGRSPSPPRPTTPSASASWPRTTSTGRSTTARAHSDWSELLFRGSSLTGSWSWSSSVS